MTSRHEAEANVKADHGSSRSVATTVLAALALFGRALSVEAGGADGVPPVEWTGTYSFFSDNKPSYPGKPCAPCPCPPACMLQPPPPPSTMYQLHPEESTACRLVHAFVEIRRKIIKLSDIFVSSRHTVGV